MRCLVIAFGFLLALTGGAFAQSNSGDGGFSQPPGSGTVSAGTAGQNAVYTGTNTIGGNAGLTFSGNNPTFLSTGTVTMPDASTFTSVGLWGLKTLVVGNTAQDFNVDLVSLYANTNGSMGETIKNVSSGASAQGYLDFVNDAADASTIALTSSTWTLANFPYGQRMFYLNGAGTGGVEIASNNASGTIKLLANNAAAAQFTLTSTTTTDTAIPNTAENNILCYSSSTGAISYEPSVATCVPSAIRFKNLDGLISPQQGARGIEMLRSAVFTYKDTERFGSQPYVGPIADDVAKMDPRCATHDADGQLENYDQRCLMAYMVADLQEIHQELHANDSSLWHKIGVAAGFEK